MSHEANIGDSANAKESWAARIRLRMVDEAVTSFFDTATAACAVLEDFGFATPFVKWLQYRVIPLVEDYEVQIEECSDDGAEVIKLLLELKDEAAALGELLLFFDHVDDEVDKQIGQDATAAVKAEIARFIAARLMQVGQSGRQLQALLGKDLERQ
jgi:hypothetical protein